MQISRPQNLECGQSQRQPFGNPGRRIFLKCLKSKIALGHTGATALPRSAVRWARVDVLRRGNRFTNNDGLWERGLGAVSSSVPVAPLQAAYDQVAAGALDHARGDRRAVGLIREGASPVPPSASKALRKLSISRRDRRVFARRRCLPRPRRSDRRPRRRVRIGASQYARQPSALTATPDQAECSPRRRT